MNHMNYWTQGLNPEQAEAVLHTTGPLLILAGAGSGKTTVLVSRTGHLLESELAQAKEICVLTFTNKAARELKHRVGAKIGPSAADLWTGTFHSFGLKILRRHAKKIGLPSSFGVIDQGDSSAILKDLLVNLKNGAKDAFKVEKLLSTMNTWREAGQRKAKKDDEYEVMCEVLLPKYLKKLEYLGVVDFEGLLLKPLELFQTHPEVLSEVQEMFRFMMVDEFQDTNKTQFRLIQNIVAPHKNLGVVGDDDQSIYGWRGACVSNILDFPKSYQGCKVIRLERNYRSTPAILNVANQVIQKNTTRHGKVLRADPKAEQGKKPEVFIYDNDDTESEEVVRHIQHFKENDYKNSDIAILYRSNGQGGLLESVLRQNQIPYAITGATGFFDRKEVKDILAYLRCAFHPNEVAFRRIINAPPRGVGDVTMDRLHEFAEEQGVKFHVAVRGWKKAGIQLKIGEGLERLFNTLDTLADHLLISDLSKTPGELLLKLLHDIGYRDYLRQSSKDDQSLQKRWVIVEIFARVLDSFMTRGGRTLQSLVEFTDCMELRDVADDKDEKDPTPKVQLLTLHACKGLEFPAVIMIGIEEDLLPHKTLGSDISEERRLFYVGVTRARERLVLTRARTRKRYGRFVPVAPSRFLLEIPSASIEVFESGYRPVGEVEKKSLLSNLFKKLESNIASQKIERS